MRPSVLVLVVLFALLSITTARACDLCGCPTVIDGTSNFFDEGFSLGLSEQYTRYGTLQLDGSTVPNPFGQYLNSSTTQLFVNYNFDNRLGLQLNVPWINRSWQRVQGGAAVAGSASGIGDMSLVAHYLVVHQNSKRGSLTINLQGGLKLPTGSAGYLAEETMEGHGGMEAGAEEAAATTDAAVAMTDEAPLMTEADHAAHGHVSAIHGHDLAFGSGSVDGILGAGLFARQDRFFFAATAQYAIRTRGAYGYRYADDFQWTAGPGLYLTQDGKTDLKLRLNFSGEVKGRDNLNGVTADDTGVNNVFVGPQLFGNLGPSCYVQAGVDLPIVRDNTALQAVPDYRVNATANLRF